MFKNYINISIYFLLIFSGLFFGSLSFSAAIASVGVSPNEKKITVITESTDSMAEVLDILNRHSVNLAETAFFFDYDETIATLIAEWDGHVYHVLSSPDLNRTYGSTFEEAKKESNLDESSDPRLVDPFFTLEPHTHYEVLDDGITSLVEQLELSGAHVGVCSALPPKKEKLAILKQVGLNPEDYTFASGGKANTIKQYLESNLLSRRISAFALMDNSFHFSLKHYISTMGKVATPLPQIQDVPEIKVIAIEFTKFNRRATASAMKTELENMRGSLAKF